MTCSNWITCIIPKQWLFHILWYYFENWRCRWIDNIKMALSEIGLNVVDWIGLAQDRYRWRALVSSVMNLQVP
jgi:hypothetical protein